jgi:hypothetical protein
MIIIRRIKNIRKKERKWISGRKSGEKAVKKLTTKEETKEK